MKIVLPTRVFFVALVLMFLGLFFLQGCNDDDCVCPQPETGSVSVMWEPDSLVVPWFMTLPGGLFAAGNSDSTMSQMPLGEYEVTWGPIEGWLRVDNNSTTQVLLADSTIIFMAAFEEYSTPSGSISIEPMPACIDAPWVLSGPNGFITDGSHGTVVWSDLEEGDYLLNWGHVPGWVTPDPDSLSANLPDGGFITFTGVYVEKETGMIAIDPSPDSINAPWHLQGPDGFEYEGAGDLTLANIMVGDYTVTWDDVKNWATPAMETLTVLADEVATFAGVYKIDLPSATSPDILVSNFHRVYESMFFEGYESLLHEDHRTIVLQSTIDEWAGGDSPLTSLYFDRELAALIHQNIFGGMAGVGPYGNPLPPIDSTDIPVLDREGVWDPVESTVEYFGGFDAYYARYNVLLHFNKPDGTRFEVDQTMDFIVIEDTGVWKLLGIIPFENKSAVATENASYDGVLALYR